MQEWSSSWAKVLGFFFLRHHPQLSTKDCVRFDSQREAWATYENFDQMYDDVYCGMVKSRIAIELEEEFWVNKEKLLAQRKNLKEKQSTYSQGLIT